MSNRELRPYQIEAIEAITTGLADGGSGQLHAACGSGKTIMAMRAAEQLTGPDGLVVVLAPSLGLVAQILGDWKADSSITYQRFAVCSDETVAGKNDDDTVAVHTDELGVPVSTDRDQIAKWLTAEGPRLIVGTYLSANHLAAAARRAGRELDMLICDEAHHLAGVADAHTRRIMSPDALPTRRRLYVTATPRNGRGRDDEQHDTRTLSMNDEATFGPVLYSYPFSRGIAEGYLADYRIAVIGVTDREVRALLSRDDIEYVGGVGLRTAAAQVALARAYRDFGMRRAITFHGSVTDAQRFVETLPATLASLPAEASAPAPVCLHANGAMDSDQRRGVLDRLKNVPEGGWAVCSNVRCLSEGVDVPALDGVLFGNPKKSTVDIVQAASRALRLHPDVPGLSTIIVPVIVPDEGDDDAIDPGAYEALFQILRALKEHDDVLSAELNAARIGIGDPLRTDPAAAGRENDDEVRPKGDGIPGDPPGVPSGGESGTPDTPLPSHESRLSKIEFHGIGPTALAELRLVILRQATSDWWESFGAACRYRDEHGHLMVPKSYVTEDGVKLGNWVAYQRSARHALPADRARDLEGLGIVWDVLESKWSAYIGALRDFRREHGHLRVPVNYVADGLPVGRFLRIQRRRHKAGILALDRARELAEIGAEWDPYAAAWERGYAAASSFADRNGHLRVPQRHIEDGFRLGAWINTQRMNRTTMDPDRKRRLDEIGMVWDVLTAQWSDAIQAAESFKKEHGHLLVPYNYEANGIKLGNWISLQRARRRAGTLPESRRIELEQLGMSWQAKARRPTGTGQP